MQDRRAGRCRALGSTRSLSIRLKMSDQVSSAATRRPAVAAWRARTSRSGRARRAAGCRKGRSPHGAGTPRARSAARAARTGRPRGRGSEGLRAGRWAASATSAAQSSISRVERRAGPIPFEHGEFRRVQRVALAVAEHVRQRENLRSRRRPAASSSRIPARCADRRRAPSRPAGSSAVRKPCRCVSLPGEACSAAGSTSTKPLALEPAARRAR